MGTAKRTCPARKYLSISALLLLATQAILSAGFVLPGWETAEIRTSHAGSVNFDAGPGSLAVSDLTLTSLLYPPLSTGGSLTMSHIFDFRASVLRFEKIPTSVVDETLRSISAFPVAIEIGGVFILKSSNPKWIHGIWASEQLASDLRDVSSEDFSTKIAGFSGYTFSDRFALGLGIGFELVDDEIKFHPGIGLDWKIQNELRLLVCGVDWSLAYTPENRWEYSIRGEDTGEIWNLMDKGGENLSLDVSSYQLGVFAARRLSRRCRVEFGIGTTIGNEVRLRDSYGESVVKEGLSDGIFGRINLTIRTW